MIYFDNAATTSVSSDVLMRMAPYQQQQYGNASSIHQMGRLARQAIEQSRRTVASWIGVNFKEIVFTSGGTEAIHSALFGVFMASVRRHIVVSAIEHHAVLHTVHFLETLGAEVTVVSPDANGYMDVNQIVTAMRKDTLLVSVMAVNNELGTIEPIFAIAQAVKKMDPHVVVHSDMVQSLGMQKLNLGASDIDLASFSAHKIHGPKGVGALYIRQGTPWKPVFYGGSQERERRAGTENVAGIVGFAAAIETLETHFAHRLLHIEAVNRLFWHGISDIEGVKRHGSESCVPSILNISVSGIQNEILLMRLDLQGVCASAGSACTAGSLKPSHVLLACGYPLSVVNESIRFSFSEDNTLEEAKQAAEIFRHIVYEIRNR